MVFILLLCFLAFLQMYFIFLASISLYRHFVQKIVMKIYQLPNKSPEPTAVGAVSSAIAVHAASRRWLGFFR